MDNEQPPPDDTLASVSFRFFEAWISLGRQQMVGPDAYPLRDFMLRCETLVIAVAWLTHGRNISGVAEALGVSRQRVRAAIHRWSATGAFGLDPGLVDAARVGGRHAPPRQ